VILRAEVQRKDDLAVLVQLASATEADAPVERLRPAIAQDAAGEQLGRSIGAHEVGDEADRLAAVPATLMPLVDQQLPQELRPDDPRWLGSDVPAEHDESDGLIVRVDRPIPGLALRDLQGVPEGSGHGADESRLGLANAESEDRMAILVGDLARYNGAHAHRLLESR